MSTDIKVPAVGESISSGIISLWHRNDGEYVRAGDALFTLDTDKVSTEVAATAAGLVRIAVPADREVKIGEVVGHIESAAEPAAPVLPAASPAPAAAAKKETAKKEASAPAPPPAASAPSMPVRLEPQDRRVTRKKLSPLRKKISTQLVAAQRNAAILTTFNECDMSAVMKLRGDVQEGFQSRYGVKLGFMSFFIKAVVDGLKAEPQLNSRLDGDELVHNHFYDIGVAVGTERGLIVPVIRDADRKTFAELEQDLAYYAKKAREGAITIDDLQGGVFTISNGGVYGSLMSTPILNPPQSGILGMHKIQDRPVAVAGQIVIRPMMYLALSYDHRVVDGKEAVTFLVRVKEAVENPFRLFLEGR
ncbi:MAG: dihydrolipoyllysine-residue succinyltransferase [Chthoniobacterales bacterium]|jgi:2-oxoglutarate dehydrogenase E2 component (dihydrolipoamide succinyltransferase)